MTGRRRSNNGENNGGISSTLVRTNNQKEEKSRTEDNLVIWKKPFQTLTYFFYELIYQCTRFLKAVYQYFYCVVFSVLVVILLVVLTHVNGPHQQAVAWCGKKLKWCLYWVGLGILSSVGLGTGLHTFLLYLGPHIASVTMAGYECGGLNFPEPPYPDKILCPDGIDPNYVTTTVNIMKKVWLEAVMWGAGTALGELPPYFVAKTARLTGADSENLEELKALEKKKKNRKDLNYMDRAKLYLEILIEKVGFFGILMCASIPNPLFDLAGIMCGHFLVPFWTFFGATLIGKAVFKMLLQKTLVIAVFNDSLVTRILLFLKYIPVVGSLLQDMLTKYIVKQKEKLHNGVDEGSSGLLDKLFNGVIFVMISYFVLSIVNSLAQSYQKRLTKTNNHKKK